MISRSWRTNWVNLTPFFDYPPELRKVTKKRGRFPDRMPLRKVLCLAMMKASERWTRPVQNWPAALNHFALVFPDRILA